MTKFPGSRWWKFDFHTHTPASDDYGKGTNQAALKATSPEEWLLSYMRAGVDCVAVTDHNSGAWVDRLKEALISLEQAQHLDFRPLHLFPGVEITACDGVHVLALFDKTASTNDITLLLGAVHAKGDSGSCERVCEYSLNQVIGQITGAKGIPVLAHVDEARGLFQVLTGNILTPILESPAVFAAELRNQSFPKPALYAEKKTRWTEVLGSDSHHPDGSYGPRYPGSHFTWVKMGEPNLEGLRLALLDDAPLSIRRSDQGGDNPNTYASLYIEELKVENAYYCGRTGAGAFTAEFNPWLNAVIGGRGSGKSSMVEFARIALQREGELPESLMKTFNEFNQVPDGRESRGALTSTTKITLRIQKDGAKYLVQWSRDDSLPRIMQEEAGGWQVAPGDVRQRFPVRVFSQKQVFALSEENEALLRILDETPEVDKSGWDHDWKLELSNYLSLMAQMRTIQVQLGEESKIRGQLDDLLKKLQVFEGAEHATLLKEYQQRKRQYETVLGVLKKFDLHEKALRDLADEISEPGVDRAQFEAQNDLDAEALEWIERESKTVLSFAGEIRTLADKIRSNKQSAKESLEQTGWLGRVKEMVSAYQALVQSLKDQGVDDTGKYADLVQERQNVEARLQEMVDFREQLATVTEEAVESFRNLLELRIKLTTRREAFLAQALSGNRHVRIKVLEFGRSKRTTESQFRDLIGRNDGLNADILSENLENGLIADLYRSLPDSAAEASSLIAERLGVLKTQLVDAAAGRNDTQFGAWFTKHLRQLQPEALDRIHCWFPEDSLSVEYSPKGDGVAFKPLHQGSPGQKTAAILAFILAHGNEPIILDQPEDDLDNHLIYDLIVSQLRENKLRRQVIVVTHNPNIVVNGDAEAVFALDQRSGQCRVVVHGCLQSMAVRNEVCRVMEGGREAFEKRYRRIIGSV